MHESLSEFKFRPDTTTNSRVICPCASEKLMYNVVNTLAPLFFYQIFFILVGNEDIHNISDEFQIRPDWIKDCLPLSAWKNPNRLTCIMGEKSCEYSSSFIFDLINLILVGKEDMHESLDEFKYPPDTTTNTRVICPCTSEKLMYNVVNTLAPLFLIGSSSFLQVRRTTIKSWTCWKFDQIGP